KIPGGAPALSVRLRRPSRSKVAVPQDILLRARSEYFPISSAPAREPANRVSVKRLLRFRACARVHTFSMLQNRPKPPELPHPAAQPKLPGRTAYPSVPATERLRRRRTKSRIQVPALLPDHPYSILRHS